MPENTDVALGDTDQHVDTPFGNPHAHEHAAPTPQIKQLSLDEVLASAKRHRTVATICMRSDLQVEYDELLQELGGMVNGNGQLIVDKDESLGAGGTAERAQWISDRLTELRREMNAAMRRVEFEAMAEDKWRPWYDQHFPRQAVADARANGKEADLTDFNNRLIAEVSLAPKLTVDEVRQLRSVLTAPQMVELANKAWQACTEGGVDIPKSPVFLRNLRLP